MSVLNLNNYFNEIKDINYALTKIDVPYNPKEFPNKYAVGKDLDILVSAKDYNKIKTITIKYFKQYSLFTFKIIETNNNIKLRLEEKNKLHYLIDIIVNNSLIIGRVEKDNYYILSLENEKKVRLNVIKKNPHKKYHKIWLIKNNIII